jgi:hypothetical protein
MRPETNSTIVDCYFGLMHNISNENKKAIIKKLSASMKEDNSSNETRFESSFGAWKTEESAEQLALDIRNSRHFTRKIEEID